MEKKKAMLSQPMAGKTNEEITATRERAIAALEARGYEIVNTPFTDEWYSKESMEKRGVVNISLCFMAKSLENMACATRHTSARAGSVRAAAGLNTKLQRPMGLKSSTKIKEGIQWI